MSSRDNQHTASRVMQLQQPAFTPSSQPESLHSHGLPRRSRQRAASTAANVVDWEQHLTSQSAHYDAVSRQPTPKQLDALRRKFDSCIVRQDNTRFTNCNSIQTWTDNDVRVSRVQRLDKDAVAASSRRRVSRSNKQANRDTAQWTPELAADLLAVVTEAGLSKGATKSVLNAAQRGSVTSNPGILLCQVLKVQSSLECGLGQRLTQAVLKKQPTLINMSSDMLAWHLEELTGIFGQDVTASMVVKCPLLLCNCPFTIWSKLESFRSLLGTSMQHAQQCVCRQPRLLTTSSHAIQERWLDLQEVTGLDEAALQKAVVSQPALLTYHPATIADNMARMAQQLNVQLHQVVKLICRMPSLVMLKHSSFAAKLTGLAQIMGCDIEQASTMALRQPALLCLSTAGLSAKVGQLAAVLEIEQAESIRMVKSNPSLLTLSPQTLSRKLHILQATIAGITTDMVLQQCDAQQDGTHSSMLSIGLQQNNLLGPLPVVFNHDRSTDSSLTHDGIGVARTLKSQCVSTDVQPVSDSVPTAQLRSGQAEVAAQLAQTWAWQYQCSSPSIRAAYGCFAEARYSRLRLVADALQCTRSSNDVLCLAQRFSLSAVLRLNDKKFADMLARISAQV